MGEGCHEAPPFGFPLGLYVLAGDAIARAISGMWAGRSPGVCGNPQSLGRSCRAEESWTSLPCPANLPWGYLLLEDSSSE